MTPVETLLACLDGVRGKNGQWMARCPSHADRSPSLAIRETPDGTVLINCFGGCLPEHVLGAVGMNIRDLFPKALAHRIEKKRHGVSPWDALRAVKFESTVLWFIAEDISSGGQNEALCRRAQLAAERIRFALDLCDG